VTLQIVCRVAPDESVVELHGWLRGPEITEFQAACAARPLPLRIDLENLAGASSEGILALKEQQSRGARMTGASPYIDLLLQGRSPRRDKNGCGSGAAKP
jgi:hypothetical protein